ncbi:MAG: cytochrome c peroxidase [Wenzhouxiangellaceae bacterium]|nr:cytochrome c peroxidase [Wenzhouxiangellaceae bacterium]
MNHSSVFQQILRGAVLSALLLPCTPAVAQNWQPLPDQPPIPDDNPMNSAKINLGKMLYFDPRLSSTGTVSCNSCHNLAEGGDDSRPTSFGVHGKLGGRNAPTVWNAAFLSAQFWDGRTATLEEQAKGPLANPVEMGMESADAAAARIREISGYRPYFDRGFGQDSEINADTIARAMAAFERTLLTPHSAFDRFVNGDKGALTEQQQSGMRKFAATGCTACHSGVNFAGRELPMGTGFFQKFPTFSDSAYVEKYGFLSDAGRFEATGKEADRHIWRVPGLRNIEHTAPYFHNGAVSSLEEAVRVMASTQLNRSLTDQDVTDIVAFLDSLSGEFPELTLPRLPNGPGNLFQ